ncbi:Putative conserved hypothetical protein [Candidatus Fokinia solitaria]|uniref:ATPase AAA-type core domain-containing protein n=2 Tax=Candidatus Fokinia solitaria TaxID=1802984 RepID=A0A2U8BRT9_9RICK|nr:Putative conserved hypothetical protein [Candidatus Fokinia solitaria]
MDNMDNGTSMEGKDQVNGVKSAEEKAAEAAEETKGASVAENHGVAEEESGADELAEEAEESAEAVEEAKGASVTESPGVAEEESGADELAEEAEGASVTESPGVAEEESGADELAEEAEESAEAAEEVEESAEAQGEDVKSDSFIVKAGTGIFQNDVELVIKRNKESKKSEKSGKKHGDLVVITGVNGVGKTQFLKGISEGKNDFLLTSRSGSSKANAEEGVHRVSTVRGAVECMNFFFDKDWKKKNSAFSNGVHTLERSLFKRTSREYKERVHCILSYVIPPLLSLQDNLHETTNAAQAAAFKEGYNLIAKKFALPAYEDLEHFFKGKNLDASAVNVILMQYFCTQYMRNRENLPHPQRDEYWKIFSNHAYHIHMTHSHLVEIFKKEKKQDGEFIEWAQLEEYIEELVIRENLKERLSSMQSIVDVIQCTMRAGALCEIKKKIDNIKDSKLQNVAFEYKLRDVSDLSHPGIEFDDKNKQLIKFEDLSSGEQVMFELICYAALCKILSVKYLLFDEFDASLNPTLMESYIKNIRDILLENGITVVLTTHNPSTVAVVYPYELWWMERNYNTEDKKYEVTLKNAENEEGRRKAKKQNNKSQDTSKNANDEIFDKRAILQKLAPKFIPSGDAAHLIYNALPGDRKIVFVEGRADVQYLYNKSLVRKSNEKYHFSYLNGAGNVKNICAVLTSLNSGEQAIFERQFIFMLDHDEAGFDSMKGLLSSEDIEFSQIIPSDTNENEETDSEKAKWIERCKKREGILILKKFFCVTTLVPPDNYNFKEHRYRELHYKNCGSKTTEKNSRGYILEDLMREDIKNKEEGREGEAIKRQFDWLDKIVQKYEETHPKSEDDKANNVDEATKDK